MDDPAYLAMRAGPDAAMAADAATALGRRVRRTMPSGRQYVTEATRYPI